MDKVKLKYSELQMKRKEGKNEERKKEKSAQKERGKYEYIS